jgi:hypothetical protein
MSRMGRCAIFDRDRGSSSWSHNVDRNASILQPRPTASATYGVCLLILLNIKENDMTYSILLEDDAVYTIFPYEYLVFRNLK